MATSDKLQKLLETKEQIRQAIIDKGVEVGDDVVFADYSNKIAAIKTSGGSDNFLALRTSNHTNYSSLFEKYEGDSLEPFDLGTWDTSNVTDMRFAFSGCEKLISIDLSNWIFNNVVNVAYMFDGCTALEYLDIRKYNPLSIKSYGGMLSGCSSLRTLRLDYCENDNLKAVITSAGFPTGLVDGEPRKIYVNPDSIGDLTAPDGWEFVDSDGNEIVPGIPLYEPDMFRENREIEEVSVMVTSEHTDLSEMFQFCENLRTINGINKWNTSNVTNMEKMFNNCRSLESLDLSSWDVSSVTDMWGMFIYCRNLQELNLSNWDMTNASRTDRMFNGCDSLHTLRLDNCNEDTIRKIITSNGLPDREIERTRKIFVKEENVANLVPPSGWDFVDVITGEVIVIEEPEFYMPGYYRGRDIEEATTMVTSEHDDLSEMFFGCENLRTINNISEWDTSNVTNMDCMFKSCRSLASLDLNDWDVSKVESMSDMIQDCKSLVSLDLSNWDVSSVTNMWGMFADCDALETLDLSNWDMTNVSNTTYMFNSSFNLRTLRLLGNCDKETIRKIITVESFPTGDIGVLRQIFVKEDVSDLTEPEGWVFVNVE